MGAKKRKRNIIKAISLRNKDINHIGKETIDWLVLWQMDRLVEECSELIQAVMKVKRYPGNKERMQNLHEELSHVNICSSIVLGLIGDKSEYDKEMSMKLLQLESSYNEELTRLKNAGKN